MNDEHTCLCRTTAASAHRPFLHSLAAFTSFIVATVSAAGIVIAPTHVIATAVVSKVVHSVCFAVGSDVAGAVRAPTISTNGLSLGGI